MLYAWQHYTREENVGRVTWETKTAKFRMKKSETIIEFHNRNESKEIRHVNECFSLWPTSASVTSFLDCLIVYQTLFISFNKSRKLR